MKMSNKAYDVLKYIALIVLPALAALYATVSKLWSLPYPVEVVGTITALGTFLGALLQISSAKYAAEQEKDE